MIRNSLNVYLNAFLGLATDKNASRLFLIREALSADSLIELLQEWAWLQELDQKSALKLKIWFQLSYKEMALLFSVSPREISQILRNQRINLLPAYRPEGGASGEFSCFMVEQHLSPWIDGEVDDIKTITSIHQHLLKCRDCQARLQQFRDLQSFILSSRNEEPEITEVEWEEATNFLKNERKRQVIRMFIYLGTIVLISLLIAWAIFSKPDKMPNIYDIGG